ncbi:hypothetical protein [Jiangella gansuensis]|uniref:hypothetical protein n=1 Tax=Jiangella gansuensis TaxID=281473 RepID=UPI00047DFFD8|nr:hypothetical protein [Jiangella gansuensis]
MTTPLARRAVMVSVLAVLAPIAGASAAAADPTLVDVDATVEVDDQGTAQVQLDYVVAGGAAGEEPATTLSFSVLDFSGTGRAPVDDIEITTADGARLEVTTETVELKTTVTATLAEPLTPGTETELTVRYSAPEAGDVTGDRMTTDVPMLTFDLPAASTAPGVFSASVRLAPDHRYVEGFPANPRDVAVSGNRTEVSYDVPAMPALLRSVSTTGDAPLLTLSRSVNLVLVLTLLAGGAALYVSITRGRARAAEPGDAVPAPERRQ